MQITDYRFLKLAEEGNEVAHAVMKVLTFGPHDRPPSMPATAPDNLEKLKMELNDLVATANRLVDEGLMPEWRDTDQQDAKREKLQRFEAYSIGKGIVTPDLAKCGPDCGHTPAEHMAFDRGVMDAREFGEEAECPYDTDPGSLRRDAWYSGHSAGMCDTGEASWEEVEAVGAAHFAKAQPPTPMVPERPGKPCNMNLPEEKAFTAGVAAYGSQGEGRRFRRHSKGVPDEGAVHDSDTCRP